MKIFGLSAGFSTEFPICSLSGRSIRRSHYKRAGIGLMRMITCRLIQPYTSDNRCWSFAYIKKNSANRDPLDCQLPGPRAASSTLLRLSPISATFCSGSSPGAPKDMTCTHCRRGTGDLPPQSPPHGRRYGSLPCHLVAHQSAAALTLWLMEAPLRSPPFSAGRKAN